jgi:hypothetical protein
MRKISIFILIIFFPLSVFAIDKNVFKEKYPTALSFQASTLSKMRNYFETINAKSVQHSSGDAIKIYKIKSNHSLEVSTITSRITRTRTPGQINESVIYSLENGNSFKFTFSRTGELLTDSDDNDLRLLKFKPFSKETSSFIKFPDFNLEFRSEKTDLGEINYIINGMMGFNLKIESSFFEKSASLVYSFFFKEMPSPQTNLLVSVLENESTWNNISFQHSESNNGVIAPNLFFKGLSQASAMYTQSSEEYKKHLINIGFPNL